jgi:hypothetical protein
MEIITIPDPPIYGPVPTDDSHDEIDGARSLLQVHVLSYGRCLPINPSFYMMANTHKLAFPPQEWRTFVFPVTITTSLPAIAIAICDMRTLHRYHLSQPIIIFNTNDNYIRIPLRNTSCNTVTVYPFQLLIRFSIILQRNFQIPLSY